MAGMTWDECWWGDSEMFSFYLNEYLRKQEEKEKEADRYAWVIGSYIGEAIATCFSDDYKYPDKPHLHEKQIEVSESELEERNRLAVSGFMAFMDSNANHDGDGTSIRLC